MRWETELKWRLYDLMVYEQGNTSCTGVSQVEEQVVVDRADSQLHQADPRSLQPTTCL